MPIELTNEQQEAFDEIINAINYSGHRTPIFIFGKEGVGRTIIVKKLYEIYNEEVFDLVSIRRLLREKFKETPQNEIQENFLRKYNPEDFLDKLISKSIGKELLVLDDVNFFTSNKTLKRLNIKKEYLFGKYSDYLMNSRLIWVLGEEDFISFWNYWGLNNIPLKNSKTIEVKPPSLNTLKEFYENYKKSEEYEITEEELIECLEDKYYSTLMKKIKKKKR